MDQFTSLAQACVAKLQLILKQYKEVCNKLSVSSLNCYNKTAKNIKAILLITYSCVKHLDVLGIRPLRIGVSVVMFFGHVT